MTTYRLFAYILKKTENCFSQSNKKNFDTLIEKEQIWYFFQSYI